MPRVPSREQSALWNPLCRSRGAAFTQAQEPSGAWLLARCHKTVRAAFLQRQFDRSNVSFVHGEYWYRLPTYGSETVARRSASLYTLF